MSVKRLFSKIKRNVYIQLLLAVVGVIYLVNAFIYKSTNLTIFFALGIGFLLASFAWSRRTKKVMNNVRTQYVTDDSAFEELFDKYGRKVLNWTFISFFVCFSFILMTVSLGVNSKTSELLENLNGNLIFFEIAIFFLAANSILFRWLLSAYDFDRKEKWQSILKRILIVSGIYWIIASIVFVVFEYVFVLNISPLFSGLYFYGALVFNIFGIYRFTYGQKKVSKFVIATIAIALVVIFGYAFLSRGIWLTQPYINSVPNIYDSDCKISYDDNTGIYSITKAEGDFKILQLTDIHLGGSTLSYDKDMMALMTVFDLLDETRPDFVIVTGDLTFPVGYASFSFNNTAPVQQFAAFMRNTGIPWAFTYGNHDTESYAATSADGLDEVYKSLSWKTSKTLLYPYIQPDITGRSNQLIELKNPDGTINQGIFLIDSNAYTSDGFNKYDYIHDDQVEWYKEKVLEMNEQEGRIVPSMIFIHIPLQQYKTAYELYEEGSPEVKYFFGSNDEEMIDKVCCSDYPSQIFDVAKELGSTTGFFCGHDHYNNMSLEYQGIRLTYGMSIDYLVMPGIARDTDQRGATLITIHDDGSSDIKQVPYGDRRPLIERLMNK